MLHEKYKGVGERPVEEVASLVGFKLPKQYQEPSNDSNEKWYYWFACGKDSRQVLVW